MNNKTKNNDFQDQKGHDSKPPIIIKYSLMSEDILEAISDDFILREGTDYGTVDYSIEDKRARVLKQIKKEEVLIVFDPNDESVTLLNSTDYKRLVNGHKI